MAFPHNSLKKSLNGQKDGKSWYLQLVTHNGKLHSIAIRKFCKMLRHQCKAAVRKMGCRQWRVMPTVDGDYYDDQSFSFSLCNRTPAQVHALMIVYPFPLFLDYHL